MPIDMNDPEIILKVIKMGYMIEKPLKNYQGFSTLNM